MSFDGNPVGRIPNPSTVTWWLLSDVLARVGSSRHSRRSLWLGCGCIRSSLAAVPTCSASRSVRRPPVADSIAPAVVRPCSQHSRQGDSPSWRTTGSALASPCLLSLRFCRQPERGAVLQRQQRVPHGLLQCDEPSPHRAHHDCCRKEQPEAPCRLTERGACGTADRGDALLR